MAFDATVFVLTLHEQPAPPVCTTNTMNYYSCEAGRGVSGGWGVNMKTTPKHTSVNVKSDS